MTTDCGQHNDDIRTPGKNKQIAFNGDCPKCGGCLNDIIEAIKNYERRKK